MARLLSLRILALASLLRAVMIFGVLGLAANANATVVPIPIDDDLSIYIPCTDIAGNTETGSATVSAITSSGGVSTTVTSTTSDTSGNYKLLCVPIGTYNVTPAKSGTTFAPTSRLVTVPTQQDVVIGSINFNWGRSISGNVGISGATITAVEAGISTISDVNGDYTLTGLAPGTYTIAVSKSRTTFSPSQRSVTIGASGLNNVTFSLTSATVPGTLPGGVAVDGTGAAIYSIPISLPPGTAGMQPSLALTYSSQAQSSSGIAGVAWSLSGLSVIHRCPRTFVQDGVKDGVKYGSGDRFCMDGQRLISITATCTDSCIAEYRTERESFARIRAYGGVSHNSTYFKSWSKSGQITTFGGTEDSRIQAAPNPNPRTEIRLWAINRIEDRQGNYLTVTYDEDSPNGQYYPKRIDYSGHSLVPIEAPYASVEFGYLDPRPDANPMYEAGSIVKTTRLLTNIYTKFRGVIVHNYRLSYESELSQATYRPRLSSVTQCDAANRCLPSTTMVWQGGNRSFSIPSLGTTLTQVASKMQLGDFNGDGRLDAIDFRSDGSSWVSISKGTRFDPAVQWGSGHNTVSARNKLGDFNGDGLTDAINFATDGKSYVFLSNRTVFATSTTPWGTGHNTDAERNKLGDFNGDGRTDAVDLRFNQTAWVHVSQGNAFSASIQWGTQQNAYPQFSQIGDFDGDGRSDIVDFRALQQTYVSLSTGNAFTTPTYWQASHNNTPSQNSLGDFNGDGKTDVIDTRGDGALYVSLSTGNRFTVSTPWGSNFTSPHQNQIGDFNGDGRSDVVDFRLDGTSHVYLSKGQTFAPPEQWGTGHGNGSAGNMVGDFNGDGRSDALVGVDGTSLKIYASSGSFPDLVTQFTNGLGQQTEVSYQPITADTVYQPESSAIYPVVDLRAALYVASQVRTLLDAGLTYRTSYTYSGAKVHHLGRGMLGFRSVESRDLRTDVATITTYEQTEQTVGTPAGYLDYPLVGAVKTVEKWLGPRTTGIPLSKVTNTNNFVPNAGTNFLYVAESVEEVYVANNNGSAITGSTNVYKITTNTLYGEATQYGNATKITVRTNEGANVWTKETTNTYDNFQTDWVLGRLRTAEVKSTLPDGTFKVRQSSFEYFNPGDVRVGLLRRETIEPNAPTLKLDTEYDYDGFGNKYKVTLSGGVSGGLSYVAPRTSFTYFEAQGSNPVGRFPTRAVNALNQSESREYDPHLGVVTRLIGPNLLATNWSYDSFGRKVQERRADGTSTTQQFDFCDAVGCAAIGGVYRLETTTTGGVRAATYFDRFNRELRSETTGFGGALIYKDTQYDDSFMRVLRSSKPYYSGGAVYWATPTYDALGRVVQHKAPDNSITSFEFAGMVTIVTPPANGSGIVSKTRTVKNSQGQTTSVTNGDGLAVGQRSAIAYQYDHFGNLIKTTDSGNNATTLEYDIRGRKKKLIDPDMGEWQYDYDALSQLVWQSDPVQRSKVWPATTLKYDLLGRLTERAEPNLKTNWYYDAYKGNVVCDKGVGKLCQVEADNNYKRVYRFDSLGRVSSVEYTIDNLTVPYRSETTYDSFGRIDKVKYPASTGGAPFEVQRVYDASGYLLRIVDAANTSTSYWRANTLDAEGHITSETLGNELTTLREYVPETGRIKKIDTGGMTVQHMNFTFDPLGNLIQRVDHKATATLGLTENFSYDGLHRLTQVAQSGATSATKIYGYDAYGLGNLKTRPGLTLNYPTPGLNVVRPHAATSVTGTLNGVVNPTYEYDANGNLLREKQSATVTRQVDYLSFNLPFQLSKGTTTLTFLYDADHVRIKETYPGSIVVFANEGNSLFFEKEIKGNLVEYKHYINSPSGLVAIYTRKSDNTTDTKYVHHDHLGSIAVVTSGNAGTLRNVVERSSYDAWGARRNPNGTDASNITSFTRRGFTEHEHLQEVGLIHMNGRVYDPGLGRFVSPDPTIAEPDFSQDYNRYSYVTNNPLSFTDPTGFMKIKEFWEKYDPGAHLIRHAEAVFDGDLGGAMTSLTHALIPGSYMIDSYIARHPNLASIATTAGNVGCVATGPWAPLCAAGVAAYATAVFGGSNEDILKSAAIAGVSAYALNQVGAALDAGKISFTQAVVLHGAIGCASAAAGGGSCAAGAFSGAAGKIASDFGIVAVAVVGGTAAELGGGKFANGAVTATFGYLFNKCMSSGCPLTKEGGVWKALWGKVQEIRSHQRTLQRRALAGDQGAMFELLSGFGGAGVIKGVGGSALRRFGNVDGGALKVDSALDAAQVWLGRGYQEIAPGVFRSADNAHQFRMTTDDLLDPKQGPHVHFESIGANGRIITENSHVRLIDP